MNKQIVIRTVPVKGNFQLESIFEALRGFLDFHSLNPNPNLDDGIIVADMPHDQSLLDFPEGNPYHNLIREVTTIEDQQPATSRSENSGEDLLAGMAAAACGGGC